MKPRRVIALFSLVALCVVVVVLFRMLSHQDPCAHLFRLARHIDILESRGPRPLDHFVGLLHNSTPLAYYRKVLAGEIKALAASGQVVEFRIPFAPGGLRSDREIALAALDVNQQTGAEYWIDCDVSNRVMVVVCRSRDGPSFSAALK